MLKKFVLITSLITVVLPFCGIAQNRISCDQGKVKFTSDAPLELIKASTQSLKGIIDLEKNTFAYTMEVASFKGFNSPLQQQHFYENYLHTAKYPRATFLGKIIDPVNFHESGVYQVRAKGMLEIHGQAKERIIPCQVTVTNGSILVTSSFYVPLDDHNINIPKIVNQKIAEEILVEIEASFNP